MTQEALKLALDALETELSIDWTNNDEFNASAEKMYKAIAAIKEALAQPEQEPVACAECERLRGELKKANDQAEHFERAWYLRGDEIEQLKAQPKQEPVACWSWSSNN